MRVLTPRPGLAGQSRRLLSVLAAVSLTALVTGCAASAAAGPPGWRAGDDQLRPIPLAAAQTQALRDQAIGLTQALGLVGSPETIARSLDRFRQETIDEVALSDGQRPTGLLVHDVASGRVRAVTNLDWSAADDLPLVSAANAPARATAFVAAAALPAPSGTPAVRWDEAADAWEVRWPRIVDGWPVPTDDLIVYVRRGGRLSSLAAPQTPLADAPASTIPVATAMAVARDFVAAHGLDHFPDLTIESRALAWTEADDFAAPGSSDAPDPQLHLCHVLRLAFTPPGAVSARLIELHIDAGTGALIGGDQTS
jgi:hypothetical protein